MIISVGIGSLAAYAFSWMKFKGRDWLFVGVVALLVVPLQMALIPLLRLITGGAHIGSVTIFPYLHLNNTVAAVWIAHTCFGLPFCIFILKNFISSLPKEIIEAARVDGAGHLTVFSRLVLPLSVPALASLAIFQFMWIWNDLLIGIVFAGPENRPIVAKLVEVSGTYGQSWHLLTAAAFVSMFVPLIVFFALQRYFVQRAARRSGQGMTTSNQPWSPRQRPCRGRRSPAWPRSCSFRSSSRWSCWRGRLGIRPATWRRPSCTCAASGRIHRSSAPPAGSRTSTASRVRTPGRRCGWRPGRSTRRSGRAAWRSWSASRPFIS